MENSTPPQPQRCDLLITGGVVLTLDDTVGVIGDAAVAVTDSSIDAVGTTRELTSHYTPKRCIDAAGRIILPGLVNTHNHTPLMIVRGMAEDLGFAPAYTPSIPQGYRLSEEEAYLFARLGVLELLRFGSTTVVDYYRHPSACARAAYELGVRAFIGGRIHDADMAALSRGEWHHDRKIGEATIDESLDLFERWEGADNGRIHCILAPHAPDTCSRALLQEVAALAGDRGLAVHTHLAQSTAENERVLAREGRRPVEVLDEVGLLNEKLVAAHCIFVNEAEIERLGHARVRVAHAPIGNLCSGMIAPTLALEAAGATITLCTDTKSGDMFECMRVAIAAARTRGADYASINGAKVLRWASVNGARALALDGRVGMLRKGFKADFVILERAAPNLCPVIDGQGIVVHSACGANVDTVIVDGRVVVEGRRPTLCSGEEIVAAAQTVADRLWNASGFRPVLAPDYASHGHPNKGT